MTTTLKVGIAIVVWTLVGGSANAQSPQTTGGGEHRALAERYVDTRNGLSLADAVTKAIGHEPTLRAARTDIDAARGMRLQAGLRPNPSTSFERREEPAGTDNQTTVQVQWPLDMFRRASRIGVADSEIQAAERSVDERIRMVVGDVRQRYGQAAAAAREVAVADNVAASIRRSLELLRQRVEEGAARPLDRDVMEVELRRAEAERLLAAGRADAAMFELRRALGARADTPLMLRDTLETLSPPPIIEVAEQEALVPAASLELLGQRPDVREAEARLNVAESLIERARSEGRFDVSLFGSYMRMDQGFGQLGFNETGGFERVRGVFHYVSAGAMVTVPLRNRNQGEIASAQAARAGAAARLESTQLTAQAELASAIAQELQARRAVAIVEGAARLARQNLDVLRQTHELGRATVSDVLAEQRRYLDVERAYTDTLHTAYEARIALQRARGER